MTIEESNLTFEFDSDTHAVKFDDTEFYQKYFNKMPGNCIVKTAGRYPMLITPCSICQTALPAFGYQFHPFFQGTPWSTFLTHNETSKCSKFLSPIKRSVVKIYLLSSLWTIKRQVKSYPEFMRLRFFQKIFLEREFGFHAL